MAKRPEVRPADLEPYVKAGLQLIPLHPFDAYDTVRATNKETGKEESVRRERGKTPRDGAWQKRHYDLEDVMAAARKGVNVGVRLPPDVVVVDCDPRNYPEGRDCLMELVLETGLDLSTAPHTRTGSGGDHYWFRKPDDVTLVDSLQDFPGVEFKSLGRQVVAAGSVHPCGAHYEWDDFAPPLGEMPALPDDLLRMARRPTKAHGEAKGLGELTPERLADVLDALDPAEFRDHEDWLNLMMACHHATAGEARQEFVDWCTSDPQYASHAWQVGRRWDSLHVSTGARPVTIRYLYKVLQERGLDIPPPPPEDDFDEWEDVADGEGVDDASLREPPEPEGVAAVIAEMNAKHAAVFDGGKFRIFTEEVDPVLNRAFYQRSTKEDFHNYYLNAYVEHGDKLMNRAEFWLRQPGRRQYRGVIFDPERNHDGWLNLWKGWAVEPRRGDWSLMQELIRTVLVAGDAYGYEYVLNWIAHMVQRPASPGEVALCFRGEKGTGKGTLGRAVASLAGAHGLHISSPEHLTGRFNSHLQNCICLFADEAFWAGDKSGESKLKQLVTEPTLTYEGKGRDAVTGKNLIHIVMASNAEWVVPAGLDGERRFGVFEVTDARRGDHKFFQALNDQMYRRGGLEAMLFDLLQRDIKGWAPRHNVPQTNALVEQKVQTADVFDRWWMAKLTEGFVPNQREDWRTRPTTVLAEYLRKDFMDFAKEVGVRWNDYADPSRFGRRIAKVAPKAERKQVTALDTEYGVRVDTQGRAVAYVIPPLDDCRKEMDRLLGGPYRWPSV